MTMQTLEKPRYQIKEPKTLSPRVRWLRDYYFQGVKRKWNNEFTAWTTGTPWDFQYQRAHLLHRPRNLFLHSHLPFVFRRLPNPSACTLPSGAGACPSGAPGSSKR